MRALLVYALKGKAVSVESGARSALSKKMSALKELPDGTDEVQLFVRDGGFERRVSAAKLAAKAGVKKPAKKVAKKAAKKA